MHQVIRKFLLIYFIVFICSSSLECPISFRDNLLIHVKKVNLKLINSKKHFEVKGSVYHPVSKQTDSSPLETASLKMIDTNKLKLGHIRWVAISRDLHNYWGGHIKYGDTLYVKCKKEPKLNGTWIVYDVMSPKWKLKIDFLQHQKTGLKGYYKKILVEHRPRNKRRINIKNTGEFSRTTGYKKKIINRV